MTDPTLVAEVGVVEVGDYPTNDAAVPFRWLNDDEKKELFDGRFFITTFQGDGAQILLQLEDLFEKFPGRFRSQKKDAKTKTLMFTAGRQQYDSFGWFPNVNGMMLGDEKCAFFFYYLILSIELYILFYYLILSFVF